jgi:hypothetical protein
MQYRRFRTRAKGSLSLGMHPVSSPDFESIPLCRNQRPMCVSLCATFHCGLTQVMKGFQDQIFSCSCTNHSLVDLYQRNDGHHCIRRSPLDRKPCPTSHRYQRSMPCCDVHDYSGAAIRSEHGFKSMEGAGYMVYHHFISEALHTLLSNRSSD